MVHTIYTQTGSGKSFYKIPAFFVLSASVHPQMFFYKCVPDSGVSLGSRMPLPGDMDHLFGSLQLIIHRVDGGWCTGGIQKSAAYQCRDFNEFGKVARIKVRSVTIHIFRFAQTGTAGGSAEFVAAVITH